MALDEDMELKLRVTGGRAYGERQASARSRSHLPPVKALPHFPLPAASLALGCRGGEDSRKKMSGEGSGVPGGLEQVSSEAWSSFRQGAEHEADDVRQTADYDAAWTCSTTGSGPYTSRIGLA